MMDLANHYGKGPVALKSIAERHNLSDHYLEQLVIPLRNAGLVKSIRGAYGGYKLNRAPQDITAGDVIRVLEGPIRLVECSEDEDPATRHLWLRIRDSVNEVLNSTTLQDLITFEDKGNNDYYMFYI